MINQKATALLGSVLLLAAAVPFALAHSSASDPDVSGNYYGPAGAYTVVNGTEIFVASMLCDMEVLGSGTSHQPLDEKDVEGHDTDGNVPDGAFDDGGQGGACHTANQYTHGDYNTGGCGRANGNAFAADSVFDDVWLGTACDWKSTTGGESLAGCVLNEVISGADPLVIAVCVTNFVNGNSPGGMFDACGADGSADAGMFGLGAGAGVEYPDDQLVIDDGCTPSTDAGAAVFVYEDGTNSATTGHIWQGASSTKNCTEADGGQPNVTQFGCKDANGDICIVWTSVYTAPPGTATNTCTKFK